MLDAAASLKLLDSALTVTSGIHVRPSMKLCVPCRCSCVYASIADAEEREVCKYQDTQAMY